MKMEKAEEKWGREKDEEEDLEEGKGRDDGGSWVQLSPLN